MVRVVISLFLIFFTYKCSAIDPAKDTIYIEFDNVKAFAKTTTLLLYKPFTIVIKSTSNEVRNITYIKCHLKGNPEQNFVTKKGTWYWKNRVYKAQEKNASNSMNSNWHCDITYYDASTTVNHCNFTFEVTVKPSEYVKHSEVFVNDVLVKTSPVDQDTAKGTYKYSVGEIVKVTCKMLDAPFMNMSYFNDNGLNISTKGSSDRYQMYLKIRETEKAYVVCNVLLSTKSNAEQSIKLDFIRKRQRSDLPKFVVNGLTLAPALADGRKHYTLFYEYFEGEFINLTVSNVQEWKTSERLKKTEDNGDKLIYSNKAQNETIIFTAKKDKKITFHLRPVPNYFNAIVSGLPFSQTNVKYLYNSTKYRTEFFNKNNNILNLKCSSPDYANCKWDQNLSMTNNTSTKDLLFSPLEHTNQSTVMSCMCAKYIHEVTILRDTYTHTQTSSEEHQETKYESKQDSSNTPDLKLVVIIVVALIVVASVVWLMVGLYKRRQRREKVIQSEFNYESLENTTERTMPPPAQWDNYSVPVDRQNGNETDTYSVPYQARNVEEMYAKAQSKSLRKPPNETLYAEPSYATVEKLGEKPTYGNMSNQTAEYSQIQPKKLMGNPNAPKVLPTETPYAEVLPKSIRQNKEYANIFDNKRYVNSDKSNLDTSEYAEPAYCEIGFQK